MGSTHVVEQLSFYMFPAILTFDFDLILWSFLIFWGPNGLVFGDLGGVRKLSWGLLMYLKTFIFYVSFNSDL